MQRFCNGKFFEKQTKMRQKLPLPTPKQPLRKRSGHKTPRTLIRTTQKSRFRNPQKRQFPRIHLKRLPPTRRKKQGMPGKMPLKRKALRRSLKRFTKQRHRHYKRNPQFHKRRQQRKKATRRLLKRQRLPPPPQLHKKRRVKVLCQMRSTAQAGAFRKKWQRRDT